jgi:lysophospholipase L1-like esterase
MAHVSLADWHAAIAGRTSLLWPDRIHPQPAGAKVYAQIVLAAIAVQLPHVATPSCGQQVSGPR